MTWWRTKKKYVIHVGACSDIGRVRSENQDAFVRFPNAPDDVEAEQLFVVADGMGGHRQGREASHLAVEVLQQTFFADRQGTIGARLRRAFEAANRRIFEREDGGTGKMGTTCTALVLAGGLGHIAHVGDSRAYRIDRQRIEQLTEDHTLVEQMRRHGVLNGEEARTHPRRHALTRAIGVEAAVQVDVLEAFPIRPGDWYLLCSDGLESVSPQELQQITVQHPPQKACEQLVAQANRRDGNDNITVLIVQIQ